MPKQPITVGPLIFAAVKGDVYEAVTGYLDRAELTWTDLAGALNTSRQNIQRAVRLQKALRLETLFDILRGVAALKRRAFNPSKVWDELEAMGLKLATNTDENTAALLMAAEMVKGK